MHPNVSAELARGGGLITRLAARSTVSDEELRALLRRGEWVRVRRGVYATREHWDSLDDYVEKPTHRVRAALLTMSEAHVVSHDSAALLHGLPVLRVRPELVHVTRDRHVIGSRTHYGVKHHGAPYRAGQVMHVDGVPCLDPARTAVDIAREHGLRHGLVACDSAMRMGSTRQDLWGAVRVMRYWRGVRAARAAIELSDAGAESVGESLARELVVELGIGAVATQFEVRDRERSARCDLRVGRHLFEFDGRVKYQRAEDGGVALVDASEVVWLEKQRQDWLCGLGFGMSRIVWSDLWGAERARTKERLLSEYAATEARWGRSLDGVSHLVVRRPGTASA